MINLVCFLISRAAAILLAIACIAYAEDWKIWNTKLW
jgi:hypothetical protein